MSKLAENKASARNVRAQNNVSKVKVFYKGLQPQTDQRRGRGGTNAARFRKKFGDTIENKKVLPEVKIFIKFLRAFEGVPGEKVRRISTADGDFFFFFDGK